MPGELQPEPQRITGPNDPFRAPYGEPQDPYSQNPISNPNETDIVHKTGDVEPEAPVIPETETSSPPPPPNGNGGGFDGGDGDDPNVSPKEDFNKDPVISDIDPEYLAGNMVIEELTEAKIVEPIEPDAIVVPENYDENYITDAEDEVNGDRLISDAAEKAKTVLYPKEKIIEYGPSEIDKIQNKDLQSDQYKLLTRHNPEDVLVLDEEAGPPQPEEVGETEFAVDPASVNQLNEHSEEQKIINQLPEGYGQDDHTAENSTSLLDAQIAGLPEYKAEEEEEEQEYEEDPKVQLPDQTNDDRSISGIEDKANDDRSISEKPKIDLTESRVYDSFIANGGEEQ